jgi:hypothetical protein
MINNVSKSSDTSTVTMPGDNTVAASKALDARSGEWVRAHIHIY